MSLHDVDKKGDHRGNPSMNVRDTLAQRQAAATTSLNPITEVTTKKAFVGAKRIIDSGKVKISYTASSGTASVLIPTPDSRFITYKRTSK